MMKQSKQTKVNPQVEKAADALKALAPMVTTEDRKTAPVSKRTVDYYLAGRIMDVDTAAMLIEFFKKRIKERDKLFAAAI